MKKIVVLFLSLVVVFTSCKKEIETKLLTSRIEYDVVVFNNADMEYWINNVNHSQRIELIKFLFSQLNNGNAVDSLGQQISYKTVENIALSIDSTLDFSRTKLINYIENGFFNVDMLRFREKWTYNPQNMQIFKQVLAVAPVAVEYDSIRNITKAAPLFWVNADTLEAKNYKPLNNSVTITDAIIQNTITPITKVYGNCPSFFSALEQSQRDEYFKKLREKITNRSLPAYSYYFDDMPLDEIEQLKDHVDTVWAPDENNILQAFPIEKVILPQQFARLKFVEHWEYSTEPFSFRKTVLGVNPSIAVIDEYDIFQGFRPLFWTVFNEDSLKSIRRLYSDEM